MEPYQERVVEEKKELDKKLEKLETFVHSTLYNKLPDEDQRLLASQLSVMREYSTILGDRIAVFKVK